LINFSIDMKDEKKHKINVKLWQNIAIIAGIFSFVMCFLIIANYIQLNRHDPVNTEIINSLVERLNENPKDEALRQEIRELDLLVRKAYFTNQWQIKMGGYLLLMSIAIFIIAFQVIEYFKKINPEIPSESTFDILQSNLKARKWIGIAGAVILVSTVIIAFTTQHQLKEKFIAKVEHQNTESTMQDDAVQAQANVDEGQLKNEQELVGDIQEDNANEQAEEIEKQDQIASNQGKIIEDSKKEVVETKKSSASLSAFPTLEEMKQNFPAFRGYNGNAIAFQQNIPEKWNATTGENLKWKTEIPLHGFNSPIIWGDKIFITGANATSREVYCFDINTGKILWTAKADNIPGSPEKSPEVTHDTGHAAPTAATDGRRVYAIFSNGDLIALTLEGERVWAKNLGLPENHYGHSSSLMLHENVLIVQYDQRNAQKIMALNTKTGDEIWKTTRKVKISWASPIVVNTGKRTEIILAADPGVQSYDVKSGNELWNIKCVYGEVGPSVAYDNGIVFASNEYANLVAIKIDNPPAILWESYDYLSDVPSPVAKDGLLYLPTSYGVIVCYEGESGNLLWEHEFENGFYGSAVLAEEKIYIIDKKGNTKIFKTGKEFSLIASNPLGEDTFTTPAFANGKIIIRGDNNLYCFGK